MFRFSLGKLFIAMAVAAFALFVLIQLREKSRVRRYEDEIVHGLGFVAAVLKNYTFTTTGRADPIPLPTTLNAQGAPLYSWRVEVLKKWTMLDISLDFGKPWNAPTNLAFAQLNRGIEYCTQAARRRSLETSVFAIVGPGTAFDPSRKVPISELNEDTILAMEVVNSGVHWMQPGDYSIQKLASCQGLLRECLKPLIRDRVHVLFADGEIWAISGEAPMESMKPFFTIAGAAIHSRETELAKFRLGIFKIPGLEVVKE
jgi:hypothetical protein